MIIITTAISGPGRFFLPGACRAGPKIRWAGPIRGATPPLRAGPPDLDFRATLVWMPFLSRHFDRAFPTRFFAQCSFWRYICHLTCCTVCFGNSPVLTQNHQLLNYTFSRFCGVDGLFPWLRECLQRVSLFQRRFLVFFHLSQ